MCTFHCHCSEWVTVCVKCDDQRKSLYKIVTSTWKAWLPLTKQWSCWSSISKITDSIHLDGILSHKLLEEVRWIIQTREAAITCYKQAAAWGVE